MGSPAHLRATLRRARATGARFASGVLPWASARRSQDAALADEWAAANLDARRGDGPLWVALGDDATLGVGATTRATGWVARVADGLRGRGAPWRVVNLARARADLDDVLTRQLPALAELTADAPAALVSCTVGVRPAVGRAGDADARLRTLLAALPPGAVVVTRRPRRGRPPSALDATLRDEAARHGLRVVDPWATAPARRLPGSARRFDDVGHAAWAAAVLAVLDRPDGVVAEG